MKILISILLVILLLTSGFVAGINYRIQEIDTMGLSTQHAIDIIEHSKGTHQFYLSNPDLMDKSGTFSVLFERYGNYERALDESFRKQWECTIKYNYVLRKLRE